jgi:predicted NodU family carbamoyl transferase
MRKEKKPVYVLGTGLSHNGSACLLKDGRICVAIEKERLTRKKHDGNNDTLAIQYCLQSEGIELSDVDLVVQNTVLGSFKFGNDYLAGTRLFTDDVKVPVVTISHHLAHAYAAVGTSPLESMAVMVIDGMGSPMDECIDLDGARLGEIVRDDLRDIYSEKDSFYVYNNGKMISVYKDFSVWHSKGGVYPMYLSGTKHSIGGLYDAVSKYVFGNLSDAGKLMGLAPYGRAGIFDFEIFSLCEGRVFVNYDWMLQFKSPARTSQQFRSNFQYYADIAYWTQREVERAIEYVLTSRAKLTDERRLAYTGGVALNAVANNRITLNTPFNDLYITPAPGDNGIAIGCAYYGWLEVMGEKRIMRDGNTFFGKPPTKSAVQTLINQYVINKSDSLHDTIVQYLELIPQCLTDNARNANYKIQFTSPDAGMYSLHFCNDTCFVTTKAVHNPDCCMETSAHTFVNCLKKKDYFFYSLSEGKVNIKGNIDVLAQLVNLDLLSEKIKFKTPTYTANAGRPSYYSSDDIYSEAAKLLAAGNVIGWFQGGSEFGPRALGHRSILADPRRAEMRDFINLKIKFREDFRPFAPAVLAEDVSRYFEYEGDSEYMLMVAPVKKDLGHIIPAVVHVDGSARLQTVKSGWNDGFRHLLMEFKAVTGMAVLLNTSFNRKGMPIVETVDEALDMFYETALDYLVIDNFIVQKQDD